MKENLPAEADALTAASESVSAASCPEPRMSAALPNNVIFRLAGQTRFGSVPTDFVYDAKDPHAIKVIFHQGNDKTTDWHFARDLMSEALTGGVAGIGDVSVSQIGSEVYLTLHPGTGDEFTFTYQRLPIAAFMTATTRLVMVGGESYDDLDAEIAELLT